MKKHIFIIAVAAIPLLSTSCNDFLNTVPYDALSPETTWKTEADANKFLIGCYSKWMDDGTTLYADCGSDIGYNNFAWDGWKYIGNGSLSSGNDDIADFYDFNAIRNFNDFLAHIEDVPFTDEAKKKSMIGQVKTMRAWQYFEKNWYYGGVPIIDSYETAAEAQVPRNKEEEVKQFIYKELDEAIPMLSTEKGEIGTINRAVALAIKMRSALYYGDYARAKQAAVDIAKLGSYDLEPSETNTASGYQKLFRVEGQNSKEIILSIAHDQVLISNGYIGSMYNNADGGWSSMVPTQNLVDMYEMNTGLTKEEAGNAYDPTHPFANRDPRMAATILYPGQNWNDMDGNSVIINTLDKNINDEPNKNDPNGEDNASKTGLTWAKYLGTGANYYAHMWNANANTIIFRYAEVLLSFAEAKNELEDTPQDSVYEALNKIRNRAGMPDVDRSKYATKESLRELIRRERTVELAGEGFRRADILRWKDNNGKMLAETVLNGPLNRITGTINYAETDPEKRATVTGTELVENRIFQPNFRYLPIPQKYRDTNPKLDQNPGY